MSLVSVLGRFQLGSLLYLVSSLHSNWPFVVHSSVEIMPCAFRLVYVGIK